MSNILLPFLPQEPRAIAIVEKLIERTQAGRLTWTRTPSTYETSLKNGTRFGFVASPSHLITMHPRWDQFSLRQRNGEEVLKIENSSSFLGAIGVMYESDPVRAKLNELFAIVTKKGKDELDSILGELDNT